MSAENQEENEKQESLVTHLVELRDRLIKTLIGVVAVLLCLFPFANEIYTFLA